MPARGRGEGPRSPGVQGNARGTGHPVGGHPRGSGCRVCPPPGSAASTQGTCALGRVARRLLVPGKDFREQEMAILIGGGGAALRAVGASRLSRLTLRETAAESSE